ncbi:MAG TPA: hypothetical protein VMF64_00080 [Steroidobacteraceae bacterium]|nr:hypothetical protein [Steroidobacteraceae bacterium]
MRPGNFAISVRAVAFLVGILAATLAAPRGQAQVPAAVAAQNRATDGRMDLAGALRLYASQEERAPYRDVHVERDIHYGASTHQRLDLFIPTKPPGPAEVGSTPRLRPVLIFVAPQSAARASLGTARRAYDNVALWAVRQGLIGVTMQRRDDEASWQAGAQDLAAAVSWMKTHVRDSGGDPQRLIFVGAGVGGAQLLNYLAHHEYWCCQGPGVAAAALLGAPLNLMPLVPTAKAAAAHTPDTVPAMLMDPAHSDLPGLDGVYAPVFIGVPQYQDQEAQRSATILQQELCRRGRCPSVRYFPSHSVISAMLSFDTADQSVSRQVLAWLQQQHR